MKRINKFKCTDKYKKQAFISRIDDLNLPLEKMIMNYEKLLEDHTILIPNIEAENKTREIDFLMNHIESLINELDFFLRDERKKRHIQLTKEISDQLDENMIDIDELYDRVLFGNSFRNTVDELSLKQIHENELHETSHVNYKFKNKECKENKDHENSTSSKNLYVRKSDKNIQSAYLRNIKNKNCFKILKNTSKENNNDKDTYDNKLKFINKKKDLKLKNNKRNDKKDRFNRNNSGLIKRILISSKLGFKRLNSLIFRKNKIKVRHRNEYIETDNNVDGLNNVNCFKCYNKTNADNSNICYICKSVYHTYCINLKVKNLGSKLSEKVCNYCIKLIMTKEICKKNNTNINILNDTNDSIFDYNYEFEADVKNNQNITLEEEQIPNVNYKCQRLEYGIRKFSNDFNINNTLFLECINKLISKDNI